MLRLALIGAAACNGGSGTHPVALYGAPIICEDGGCANPLVCEDEGLVAGDECPCSGTTVCVCNDAGVCVPYGSGAPDGG